MPFHRSAPSYGNRLPRVQRLAALLVAIACLLAPALTRAADRPVKIVALGDSLTAGYGLPVDAAFPAKLAARCRRRASR